MLKFSVLCVLITSTVCHHCDNQSSVVVKDAEYSMLNGDVLFENVHYKKTEYFFVNSTLNVCVCEKKICVYKCCPYGYAVRKVKDEKLSCVQSDSIFNVTVHDEFMSYGDMQTIHFNTHMIKCQSGVYRVVVTDLTNNFFVKPDGKLYIQVDTSIPPRRLIGPDSYCIDNFMTDGPSGTKATSLNALACFADEDKKINYLLSSTCMVISCVFILVTVVVYAWLPELRNLHGRVLMAYLLCLFVGFACLATMQILLTIDNITAEVCIVLTIIIYFALLAAFFWLNVMCFDIWWTFSGKRGITNARMSMHTKFLAYSIYAFGIPTALTLLLIVLEFSGLPHNAYLPELRTRGCFLNGPGKLIYLYLPMVILCCANMVFFVLTANKIREIKKETSVLKSKESATHDQQSNEKQRLSLYVKLFIVMGVNWLLEVISALFPDSGFWYFTDAYNVLVGLIIFIIFVCKRKIFYLIKKRIKESFRQRTNERQSMKFIDRHQSLETSKQRDSVGTVRTNSYDTENTKEILTTSM